jgi:acyl carrier protein
LSSYEFLCRLLVTEFGARPAEITPESTPASVGLDSLSTAELIRELEEEFGIEISNEQADFATLGEAAAIVDALIEAEGT